jgi:aspartate/methionine/tyrosine aminotransferase
MLVLNAPNNPTGWTLTADEQRAILAHCRRTGTWILADEVYERLYFAPSANGCAPSFLDCAEPDDRLVVAHSFSKSFLMTGWRLGWLVLPPSLVDAVGKLVEFNTSCAPVFVQRAACAALAHGDTITPDLVTHLKACRDLLVKELSGLSGVTCSVPLGGMYAFFRIDGQTDSLATAKRLVLEAGLGLAPGSAFGAEAEGWLRWCFATRDMGRLHEGVERLRQWLRL